MIQDNFDTHGRIKCGTIVTPWFVRSLNDYRRVLGMQLVEEAIIDEDLAEAWAAPDTAGKRMALLQPASGASCFIRLIEGSAMPGYQPLRSYGWAALELTIGNIESLRETIEADGAFTVVGVPMPVDGLDNLISMQLRGQADEILYLDQVQQSLHDLDLPIAVSDVDHIFMAILAAPDRQRAHDHYVQAFGFEAGASFEFVNVMLNQTFGLAADEKSMVSMTSVGRLPCVRMDQYPSTTGIRPIHGNELPPGVAMVSFAVRSLDAIQEDFITAPVARHGPLYVGRRTATVLGPADELIELIEVG